MNIRVFIGIIGTVLVIGALWAWDNYTPTVGNGYTVVKCGTLHHTGSREAHDADMKARLGGSGYGYSGAPWELTNKCREKSEALAVPIYGTGAIGLLAILGACAVRTRKSTTA